MFVQRSVRECDFTGKKYSKPVQGAAAVARGATGRSCEVMWAGPEYLASIGAEVLSYEQAVAEVHRRKMEWGEIAAWDYKLDRMNRSLCGSGRTSV